MQAIKTNVPEVKNMFLVERKIVHLKLRTLCL